MGAVAGISDKGWDLGGYLREQREHARLSVRQLANLAGVSNPYLSQVERGLRKPSAEVLQQIARGLRISAEALYVRAGILDSEGRPDVEAAVNADPDLNDRQRRVLLDIYASFRAENRRAVAGDQPEPERPPRRRPAARVRSAAKSATTAAKSATSAAKSAKSAKAAEKTATSAVEPGASAEPAPSDTAASAVKTPRPRKRAAARTAPRATAKSTRAVRKAAAAGGDVAGSQPDGDSPDEHR
jgi:transcriptional regulator with XRE-family HTH domain